MIIYQLSAFTVLLLFVERQEKHPAFKITLKQFHGFLRGLWDRRKPNNSDKRKKITIKTVACDNLLNIL